MKKSDRLSAAFSNEFLSDLRYWVDKDRSIALRLLDLVEAVLREPFAGIGKPELLRHEFAACWSRRINHEHRLVYRLRGDTVEFVQARFHY